MTRRKLVVLSVLIVSLTLFVLATRGPSAPKPNPPGTFSFAVLGRLENLTRVQVPGSPLVGWVRVTVTPGADEPFAFESNVVPAWKHW